MKAPGKWPDPVMDIEKATKAAQCADLLCNDLRDLVKSENLLLSDVALAHLQTATRLRTDLERIAGLLTQMGVKS